MIGVFWIIMKWKSILNSELLEIKIEMEEIKGFIGLEVEKKVEISAKKSKTLILKNENKIISTQKYVPEEIVSEQNRRIVKMNELKIKIIKKINKFENLAIQYNELLIQNDIMNDGNLRSVISEIQNKLFDGQNFKNQNELLDKIEHLDISQMNVEVFVKDFFESKKVKAIFEHKIFSRIDD